jgi:hypothetical protein
MKNASYQKQFPPVRSGPRFNFQHRKPIQAAPSVPKAELRRQAELAYQQFKAAPARPAARPRPTSDHQFRRHDSIDQLDTRDPHDQLAGVDLDDPPWDRIGNGKTDQRSRAGR